MSQNVSDIYPGGNYLNVQSVISGGLVGRSLAIAETGVEEVGTEGNTKKKIVLCFIGIEKHLALNKTNASILAQKFGEDFTKWVGKQVVLLIVKVKFGSELKDSIQVVPQ